MWHKRTTRARALALAVALAETGLACADPEAAPKPQVITRWQTDWNAFAEVASRDLAADTHLAKLDLQRGPALLQTPQFAGRRVVWRGHLVHTRALPGDLGRLVVLQMPSAVTATLTACSISERHLRLTVVGEEERKWTDLPLGSVVTVSAEIAAVGPEMGSAAVWIMWTDKGCSYLLHFKDARLLSAR